jgi:dihydropteroate synthase
VEGFNPTRFSRRLMSMFIGFAERFSREGDSRPGSRSSSRNHRVTADWNVTDATLDEFRQYLIDQHIPIDEAAFNADRAFLKAMIRFEVDVDLFGVEQARRNLSAVDPQVQVALTHFNEAKELLALR